jgi:hypothetical protein
LQCAARERSFGRRVCRDGGAGAIIASCVPAGVQPLGYGPYERLLRADAGGDEVAVGVSGMVRAGRLEELWCRMKAMLGVEGRECMWWGRTRPCRKAHALAWPRGGTASSSTRVLVARQLVGEAQTRGGVASGVARNGTQLSLDMHESGERLRSMAANWRRAEGCCSCRQRQYGVHWLEGCGEYP